MSKRKASHYICQECSYQTTKWMGKCPECETWNSLEEQTVSKTSTHSHSQQARTTQGKSAEPVNKVQLQKQFRLKTDMNEFDRVLGGGVVLGSLILVGGEPGIGKSTLLASVLGRFAKKIKDKPVLYVSGEESTSQVANRVKRLGIATENYLLLHQTNWHEILQEIKRTKPPILVLDSIQTTVSPDIQSAPGTVSQIREVTYELMNYVKAMGITAFVIGHITKEGNIAGPKILEHMVDTVIYFEGDQYGHYRMLRSIKNRFGNTNEVGIFEMTESGLHEVANPSQYFIEDNLKESFGRSLSCIIEGTRPLFIEVQALVVENKFGNGRRTTQGFDTNRLAMLVAVIEKYFNLPLGYNDIYLNIVGGIRPKTREADLAVIASLISSYKGTKLDDDAIFLGEVGLTGEVRTVPHIESRLKEIQQLNYKKVYLSKSVAQKYQKKFNSLKLIGLARANELTL